MSSIIHSKTEGKRKDKYLDLARELEKKLWNMKVTIMPIVISTLGTIIKGLVQGLGGLENKTSGVHSNDSIVEISQNANSHGDMRLAATHSSGKPSVNAGVKNPKMIKFVIE